MSMTSKHGSRKLHSMSRLAKQQRDMNDLLWRVTQGGAGMVKPDENEDLGQVINSSHEASAEDLTKMMSP